MCLFLIFIFVCLFLKGSTMFRLCSIDNLDDLINNKLMDSLWLLFQSALLVGVPIVIVNLLTQAAVGGLNFAPKAMKFKDLLVAKVAPMVA